MDIYIALVAYAYGKQQTDTSFTIPDSVITIGNGAFSDCTDIYTYNFLCITFKGTLEEWNAIEFGGEYWRYGTSTEIICSDGPAA